MTSFDFPNVPPGSPERALIDAITPHLLAPGVKANVALNVLFNLYRYVVLRLPDEHTAAIDSCHRFIDELCDLGDPDLSAATPANDIPL